MIRNSLLNPTKPAKSNVLVNPDPYFLLEENTVTGTKAPIKAIFLDQTILLSAMNSKDANSTVWYSLWSNASFMNTSSVQSKNIREQSLNDVKELKIRKGKFINNIVLVKYNLISTSDMEQNSTTFILINLKHIF